MAVSDKKYYERRERYEQKRQHALQKARARGMVAEEWFSKNKLTADTMAEFNQLMKSVDKMF